MIEASTGGSPENPGSGAGASLRHLALPLGVLCLLIPAVTATLDFLNHSAIHSIDQASPIGVILPIGFAIIGALLVSRRSRNTIGWIYLGIALFVGVNGLASEYLFRSLHFHVLPFAAWAAWLQSWVVWLVYPSGLALFLFLLFPDGRFQSRRWRRLGWVAATCMTAGVVLNMVQPTIAVTGSRPVRNPLAVKALASVSSYNSIAWVPVYIGGLGLLVAAMVGTILRTRRSTGELRQQLRWLGYAAGLTAGFLVLSALVGFLPVNLPQGWMDLVIVLGFGVAVPVSSGVAILKHGLYELDIVVSKTVVYGVLAAFFTAVYVAVVVGIGTAIGSSRNPFLTLVAAALIALAFNPVRDRAKRFANWMVYGKRATPYEVLSEFAERMAGALAIEDVLPRTARMLAEGTGAVRADVWLRVGTELRAEGSWPSPPDIERIPLVDGGVIDVSGASRVVEVRHQGELLGAISVKKAPGDPVTPTEERLLDDVASQAGLVLRNVGLIEDLRASRHRIVAAQDQERRKLERNIHDGAQQQLVALAMKANLARSLVGPDNRKQGELLDQLTSDAQDALENLRDLARGIYPPLLADQGLVAALTSQTRKSAVPVTVVADGIGRFSQDVEAAVYFCSLEALQNVAKYAKASGATVHLHRGDGHLSFEITDDGIGFDPTARGYGTGTQGMADRLAALGGELTVTSSPGAGTRVMGKVPDTPAEQSRPTLRD